MTRDPVESNIQINDLHFRIFDTAGLSTNYKRKEHIQKLSEYETKRKIRLSETILIILDISNYWEKNRQIINSVIKESRATILVINKIDTIKNFSEQYIKDQISLLLPQTKDMPTFLFRQKKK